MKVSKFKATKFEAFSAVFACVLSIFLCNAAIAATPVDSGRAAKAMPFSASRLAGLMTDARLVEFSGMAPARRKDRFWAINDGGQEPILWQIDNKGKIKAELRLKNVENIDFEDLASFSLKSAKGARRHYIAVADIGDNAALNNDHKIYIIADIAGRKTAAPDWTIRFRYPDGAHDAESLMVDAKGGYLYIVIKRVLPPIMYRLPLRPTTKGMQVAEPVGILEGLPLNDPNTTDVSNAVRFGSQPTGAVFGCDGNELLLLTYASVYRYQKSDRQSWENALVGQMPQILPLPLTFQAEAITLSRDCDTLYVGGEKVPGPLWRFARVAQKPVQKVPQ